jgi:hypothetical protein
MALDNRPGIAVRIHFKEKLLHYQAFSSDAQLPPTQSGCVALTLK